MMLINELETYPLKKFKFYPLFRAHLYHEGFSDNLTPSDHYFIKTLKRLLFTSHQALLGSRVYCQDKDTRPSWNRGMVSAY